MSLLSLLGLHSITIGISYIWITWFYFTRNLCSVESIWNWTALYLCHLRLLLSPHNTSHCKHVHHFSAAHDDKINDCGSKFSIVCEWCILTEEDRDNSLEFAKIFPFKVTDSPKFSPTTVLRYTVYNEVKRKSCEQGLITKKCIAMHTNHF